MMKRLHLSLLMLLIGVWAMALDTSVKNADGVEIWYDFDSSTKTASVTYSFEKYTGEVVIPSTVTYEGVEYSVTEIGDDAFRGCSGLTSVTIPESVTEIGYRAFFGCSGLTSVTIPEGVTSIGVSAFEDCSGLTSVTIPEGVTSIRESAFYNCSGLTSVTIPESVTYIGHYAFYGTAIYNNYSNWENNVLYIDNCLIDAKTELSGEYAIKEDTRLIANYAFRGCSGLTSVTIPEGVTEIGGSAFYDCRGLTSITSKNTTPPAVEDIYTFYNVDKSIPLYVPAESVGAYKSADYWKKFINILPILTDDSPISDVKIDNISVRHIGNNIVVTGTDNYTVYSISGQSLGKVTSVERGIYIVVAEGKSYKVAVK